MDLKVRKSDFDRNHPFKNDSLDRKKDVENLALLLQNSHGPMVYSVNASWGQGKTTFLNMLDADLKKRNCKSILFSAWETDFACDPLLAFIGEINIGIETYISTDTKKQEAWKKAKLAGAHILKKSIPAMIKVGTGSLIDIEEISSLAGNLSEDLIEEYTKRKTALTDFKENISLILKHVDGSSKNLYIIVDELDRCRPIYAIELLERLKHLFEIEGLIFILAMDKDQLSHSIQTVYGINFDALGYLKRFIDIEFSLPGANLDKFINQLYVKFDFRKFFAQANSNTFLRTDGDGVLHILRLLAKYFNLTLRDIEQLFTRMSLVFHATQPDGHLHPPLFCFLLIVKMTNPDIYKYYIKKDSSPENIIAFFHQIIPEDERYRDPHFRIIEAFLIVAKIPFQPEATKKLIDKHNDNLRNDNCSPLIKAYSQNIVGICSNSNRIEGAGIDLHNLASRIEITESFIFN